MINVSKEVIDSVLNETIFEVLDFDGKVVLGNYFLHYDVHRDSFLIKERGGQEILAESTDLAAALKQLVTIHQRAPGW